MEDAFDSKRGGIRELPGTSDDSEIRRREFKIIIFIHIEDVTKEELINRVDEAFKLV